jgi:hypothetical protein
VCVVAVLLCAYYTPFLTLVLIMITCVRREKLQLMEIPHNRVIVRYKKESWYSSLIFGSLETG